MKDWWKFKIMSKIYVARLLSSYFKARQRYLSWSTYSTLQKQTNLTILQFNVINNTWLAPTAYRLILLQELMPHFHQNCQVVKGPCCHRDTLHPLRNSAWNDFHATWRPLRWSGNFMSDDWPMRRWIAWLLTLSFITVVSIRSYIIT